jgi:hypothetical protein
MSPGGPDIEFGVSTGGLDFMSSSGYPQIEFGYDDATDEDEGDSDSEEEPPSTDGQLPNGGNKMPHLVSKALTVDTVACRSNPGTSFLQRGASLSFDTNCNHRL